MEAFGCRLGGKTEEISAAERKEHEADAQKLIFLLENEEPATRTRWVHDLCFQEFPGLISPVETLWLERVLGAIDSGKGRTNSDIFFFGCYYFSREEGLQDFRVRAVNSFLSDRGRQIASVSAVADALAKGEESPLEVSPEKSGSEKLFRIGLFGFRRVRLAFFRSDDWNQLSI